MENPATVVIADVERLTGVPRATLRIWERRYGFPHPARNESGERVYTRGDIEKLRVLQRLLDHGARPGALIHLPLEQLRARLAPDDEPARRLPASTLLQLVQRRDCGALQRYLRQELARLGVGRFVLERAAPWSAEVGEAWSRGELQVYEEHLFSNMMQLALGDAVLGLDAGSGAAPPRVLLSTLSGELHALGLWMAYAMLALERCDCAMLGVATPVDQVVQAALRLEADVVALSFSASMSPARAQRDIAFLRAQLPMRVEVWAGGGCVGLRRAAGKGVQVLDALGAVPAAVANYRAART